ncbi:aspartate aminotransferase family protein [Flavobacteriaceae bacterium]|jgi:acetylornithine aminotransferase|nr:aspartate aminotransferase family protein [Flavobacteriaceae bacterium]
MDHKQNFYKYQAQTTPHPLGLVVDHASGSYIYDNQGTAHLDFVAGVSACSVGHAHPEVVRAVQQQAASYMHVMVYGEYVQTPAVELCRRLAELMPKPLETTYLVNSGTEAIEAALKLARAWTKRQKILYGKRAYHGNTMGAMSVMDYPERTDPFGPLIPNTRPIAFNDYQALDQIDSETAAVILETIQGGAGFIVPDPDYLKTLKSKCEAVGALLILDEIQPGFGRTGRLFGFEHFDVIPDIVVMGKGMGGGMPIGALTASKAMMETFATKPKLGHITTFGGHPVIAAAALATLKIISRDGFFSAVLEKEQLFRQELQHPKIKEVRGKGLMLAIILEHPNQANELVLRSAKRGLILFWLLYEDKAVRITPPLTISSQEIKKGCQIIREVLDSLDA